MPLLTTNFLAAQKQPAAEPCLGGQHLYASALTILGDSRETSTLPLPSADRPPPSTRQGGTRPPGSWPRKLTYAVTRTTRAPGKGATTAGFLSARPTSKPRSPGSHSRGLRAPGRLSLPDPSARHRAEREVAEHRSARWWLRPSPQPAPRARAPAPV